MFWGLVLEPSKKYTQRVEHSFHISQAALELSSNVVQAQLILEYDGANFVLATLSRQSNIYQVPLDLNFSAGDQISFRTIGKGRVHLTGYHILEDLDNVLLNEEEESDVDEENPLDKTEVSTSEKNPTKRKKPNSNKGAKTEKGKMNMTVSEEDSEDGDEDDDFGEEEDEYLEDDFDEMASEDGNAAGEEDEDEDMEAVEEEDESDELEMEEEDEDDEDEEPKAKRKPPTKAKKVKSGANVNGMTSKGKKMSDAHKDTSKSGKKNIFSPDSSNENTTPEGEKKSPKSEKKGAAQDANKKQGSMPQKKVLEGGVVVEELLLGEGQVAKPGRMVQVYYVGRLQNSKKQFDSTLHGPGFKFRLGKGEVIRGWDIGINGMKVGGKRRITIPAQLAYGAKGSPPAIPPNSTLVFEVELKGTN